MERSEGGSVWIWGSPSPRVGQALAVLPLAHKAGLEFDSGTPRVFYQARTSEALWSRPGGLSSSCCDSESSLGSEHALTASHPPTRV